LRDGPPVAGRNVRIGFIMSDNKKVKVAWISGAYYLAKQTLDKVRETTAGVETFDCYENTDFGKLLSFITSRSCFSENKVVVIHSLPDMTDAEKKKFKSIIENVSDGLLIVFFMINPSDERSIYNSVDKVGRIYHYDSHIPKNEAKGWITSRAKELGIQVEEDAAIAIAENSGITKDGVPIDIMEHALQRLILNNCDKKHYTMTDAISTATFYNSFVIWDLLNCCDEKNFDKCIDSFNKCAEAYGAVEAINEIIHMMAWKYRLLLSLKEFTANKASIEDAIIKASSIRKVALNGSGIKAITKTNLIESGPDAGKPVPMWNQKVCINAMNGFYGKKPQIELYSRKELYLIVKCIEDSLFFSRTCKYDNEAYLIADMIFMHIFFSLDSHSIKKIQMSLEKSRERI